MPKRTIYIIYFVLISIFSHIHAQIDVACIGNSITWGNKLPDPGTQSYPSQLAVLLGNNYVVNNFGGPGRTLLHNTGWEYIFSNQWIYSIATPHDVVIILLGTNDSQENNWVEKAHFKEDYLDLMDDYKNFSPNSEDPVFILGLPPPIFGESGGSRNATIVNEIIPMIKQVATQTDATIADFYNALNGKPELFIDGIHPNEVGAGIMAKVAYDAIQKALSTPALPLDTTPPAVPAGLKTIPELSSITLQWQANTEDDLLGYRIYRSDNPNDLLTYIGGVPHTDTIYTDNNVVLNQFYYYAIDAIDLKRNASKTTSIVMGKTLDNIPPSVPVAIQIIQKPDTILVSWSPNTEPDLSRYNIYRNININDLLGTQSFIGSTNGLNNFYFDTSFEAATTYYYGITAVDISNNQSAMSTPVSITTTSPPKSADTTLIFLEDTPHIFSPTDFPYSDLDNHQLDKILFIDSNHYEYFSYNGNDIDSTITCEDISELVFNSDLDEYGDNYAAFTFKVVDSFGSTSLDTNIVIINVTSVNDAPHINPISDLYIMEDSHNILLPISGIDAGPVNESQNLSVKAFADLVKVDDIQIQYNSPEDTGSVTIDPVENAFGIIPMTVQILDDGGTSNDGVDSSETTFYINISPINDPPIFNLLDNIQIYEDSETTIELTGIQPGPWESDQQITMSVKSNNTDILPHPELSYNSPDTTAVLTFSTIPNIFGSSSITINMSDNGGTDFGGKDSTSYTIPVEITSVNDKPSDFNIISPTSDSTLVINKSNYLNTFSISWEESSDIENDDILYNIIFSGDLSSLSRHGLISTKTEYILKEILAVTDTVSIANCTFCIIASDGALQTNAVNSGIVVTVDGRSFAPAKLHLNQNYPNPFNYATVIGFDLPKHANVSIIIYDLLGEEIIKLIDNKEYERGYNTITWNGLDKNNNLITAGIYIMQIHMGSVEQHKKLIFLK